MKRYLGVVHNNEDKKYQRRIQVQIVGLTEGVTGDHLPWAYPLDDDTRVPDANEKVWIYVDRVSNTEGYDYNRQWYRKFTEKTYKEAYDLNDSDSYTTRTNRDNKLDEEPTGSNIIKSTTYPQNKVYKYKDITVEYDTENGEYRLTLPSGSYLTIGAKGVRLKSITDSYDGTKGTKQIETTDGLEIISGGSLESMVLGDTLKDYLDNLKTWIDSHVHTAPVIGSTSTPAAPSPSPSTYLSGKNKVD